MHFDVKYYNHTAYNVMDFEFGNISRTFINGTDGLWWQFETVIPHQNHVFSFCDITHSPTYL